MKSIVKRNIHYVSNHDEHVKNDINNINNGFNANNYLGSVEPFFKIGFNKTSKEIFGVPSLCLTSFLPFINLTLVIFTNWFPPCYRTCEIGANFFFSFL